MIAFAIKGEDAGIVRRDAADPAAIITVGVRRTDPGPNLGLVAFAVISPEAVVGADAPLRTAIPAVGSGTAIGRLIAFAVECVVAAIVLGVRLRHTR